MWQGVTYQVERRLCPEYGGQRDGGYGHYWGVLVGGSVCTGAGATAEGRCGEKPRPHKKRRQLTDILRDHNFTSNALIQGTKQYP